MFKYQILLPGVPVTSERGALGWCTVALIRMGEKTILFDTGSYGDRALLLNRLAEIDLSIDQIDMVFVSHLHFDHFINAEIFSKSEIFVPERDVEYVVSGEFRDRGDTYVPELYVKTMQERLIPVKDGQEILSGLEVISLPGHTPGTLGLIYKKEGVVFASDAVKNAWEFMQEIPPPSFYSEKEALTSYKTIRQKARIIIPGHDNPFSLKPDGHIDYLASERTVINAFVYPEKGKKTIPLP